MLDLNVSLLLFVIFISLRVEGGTP